MTRQNMVIRGSMPGLEPRALFEPEIPDWFTDRRRVCAPQADNSHLIWTSADKAEVTIAAAQCRRSQCPFIDECLAWAVEHNETSFAWGGVNFSKKAEREKAQSRVAVAA